MNPVSLNIAGLDLSIKGSPRLRADFSSELESHLSELVGPTNEAAKKALTGDSSEMKLSNLPADTQVELDKLAKASEGMEAVFVQGLLTQMRRSSFAEKMDGMGAMARDLMDQTLATQISQTQPGFGIAKNVFANAAPRLVREAIAKMTAPAVPTE